MEKFNFNPPNIFMDESSYPDPISTDESREQLSRPHQQMKEFINGLVDEVNREKTSDEIGYEHDNLSAISNVKQGLDEHYRLIKETQSHLNKSDKNFNEHENDTVIHVTQDDKNQIAQNKTDLQCHKNDSIMHLTESERSRWNNTYSKDETDAAISRKVVQIGAGDMAQHIYDKDGDGIVGHAELADEAKVADYAKKTSIAQTASGEFITVETAKESAGALTIHGKTYQNQYSGKNLANCNMQYSGTNGITINDNGDGTFTLNGTATALTYFNVFQGVADVCEIGKRYRITGTPKNSDGSFCLMDAFSGLFHESGKGITFVYNGGIENTSYISIRIYANTTLNNVVFKPMLVDADLYPDVTYDDFEPYVGGMPAPNPDYPQDVHGVLPVVKKMGKNLLPYPYTDKTITRHGITYTDNGDGSVTANGTATSTSYFLLNEEINFGDRSISAMTTPNGATNGVYSASHRLFYNPYNRSASINIASGTTVYNERIWPQVELGTVSTEYEPYTESELSYNTSELYEGDLIDAFGKCTRRFKKIVLDGTNVINMQRYGSYGTVTRYNIQLIDIIPKGKVYCDRFTIGKIGTNDLECINVHNTDVCVLVQINQSRLSSDDLDGFKAWLKDNPLTIIYELAEPTEEQLTRSGDMILSKGINHVFSAEEFSPEFDLEYSPDGYPLFDWLYLNPEDIGAAPAVHNHDDRYSTEQEVKSMLDQKANITLLGTQVTYSLSGTTLTITTK